MGEAELNVTHIPERTGNRQVANRPAVSSSPDQWFDRMARRMMAPWGGRNGLDFFAPGAGLLGSNSPFSLLDNAVESATMGGLGRADFSETEDSYLLQIDLPGVNKDAISVDYSDDMLTITAERSDDQDDTRKSIYVNERARGTCQRSFRVPESVERDQISASFSDGVLTVTLPKTEEAQKTSRRIEVK